MKKDNIDVNLKKRFYNRFGNQWNEIVAIKKGETIEIKPGKNIVEDIIKFINEEKEKSYEEGLQAR